MPYKLLLALLAVTLASCAKKADEPKKRYEPPIFTDKNWEFETEPFWADEFDYTGLPNTSKWTYDTGGSGWGNNELQNYTNRVDNASVADGKLSIVAKIENLGGMKYTSARVVSRGKGDFLYGRFEIKAKLPSGKGSWPAIWMLPTDRAYGDWPKSGEIDIMEHVGYDPNVVHFSTHTEAYYFKINTQKTAKKNIPTATSEYHLYRVDWTPYAIRGYMDGVKMFEFVNQNKDYTTWPFDKKFHLLLNVAVGGDWGGAQGIDDTTFPNTMEIDYVRVYKMIEKP
ncbi:MAG: glycoside hydrolase family 16 protein [Sphingobacteriaceae bacterium]|nr:MAG: glycoside hydrolase family 16 protein [Sphingobacteriaceae bacterium]